MTELQDWRASRMKRFEAAAIGAVGYRIVALLGSTLRWRVEGLEQLDAITRSGRQAVLAFWHGRIFASTYYFRRRGIWVMSSENFDGEWMGRIIKSFGYKKAPGSTSRGGRRALIIMKRAIERGEPTGFTLDGPRGPALVAQRGAVWLASVTGNPVVPFHIEARSAWTLRSWDRAQIPKPFSQMALVIGTPVEVPRDASDECIDATCRKLESDLTALRSRALALASR